MTRSTPALLLCLLLALSPTPASADALDEKLERQFDRYRLARGFLVRGARDGAGRIGREQWEWLLALPKPDAFTQPDLDALNARHREAIEASRMQARAASRLSLDAVRDAGESAAFCRDMPKGAMLHIHPSGTLDAATLEKLLDKVNPVIEYRALIERVVDAPMDVALERVAFLEPYGPAIRYGDLTPDDQARARALFFWPPGTQVPQIAFGMVSTLRDDPTFMETALRTFFARSRNHHVLHVEMAKSLKPNRSTLEVLRRIDDLASEYGLSASFNVGLSRGNKERKNLEKVQSWIDSKAKSRGRGVVRGVDLYGREASASTLDAGQRIYAAVLDADERGVSTLRTTTHAAGLGETRNPRDAIIMGVERIGHGIQLRNDPVALEYARRLRTPIETNLTSNVRLGYVESLDLHPFVDFLRLGLRVSLSTDDEGMLETDISNECALAVEEFDLEYAELRQMATNSIETSFTDDEKKARLKARLEAELVAFEQRWSRFAKP